jgi:hypothetical protein
VMLNIRGMSIVEKFLTGVNRFGHGLTIKLRGAAVFCRVPLERFVRSGVVVIGASDPYVLTERVLFQWPYNAFGTEYQET